MHKTRVAAVAIVGFVAFSQLALGASFMVPTDRELVDLSKAIVIATAMTSYSVHVPNGFIDTVYELRVDEVIKGDIDRNLPLQLVEMGGALDNQYNLVPGSPKYAVGERALIFVGTNKRGENTTWGMILGKFNFVRDLYGRRLLIRGAEEEEIFGWDACWNRHEEPVRSESEFLSFVRAAACGKSASENYLVPKSDIAWRQPREEVNSQGFHAFDYQDRVNFGPALIPGTVPGGIRWQSIFDQPGGSGSKTFVVVGTEAGIADPLGGINRAMGAWIGDGQSNVNYIRGAASTVGFVNDGVHSIHLDNTANVPSGASGFASLNGGCCYAFDGATMSPTTDADVAVRPGLTQSAYEGVLTHELGHTLSIRHSNQATPSTTSAAMNSVCCPTGGAILAQWDRDAVSTIYNPSPGGGPPPCTPPSITVQPQSQTITAGQQATLTVTATGTAALSYQWFIGASGNTSTQTGTNSPSLTVTPASTTQFWVRVMGQCAPVADSQTATITVNPAVCTPVAITVQPPDQSVTAGGTVQLSVSFTGTAPVTVTWFRGTAGDTTQGSIGSGPTIFSPQITQPSNFWARLTNCSGTNTINTRTVSVTVAPSCAPPSGLNASASPTSINPGQQVALQVFVTFGTQPFQFQWFRGTSGDQSNSINGATAFQATDAPTTTTNYWVKVTNSCGSANSNTVTVTVSTGPGCTPPSITVQPASATIVIGTNTTLSVAAAGTAPLHFQWFEGSTGNTTKTVGSDSPNFTTPELFVATPYWVRVTGPCNPAADSATATVSVKRGRPQAVRH